LSGLGGHEKPVTGWAIGAAIRDVATTTSLPSQFDPSEKPATLSRIVTRSVVGGRWSLENVRSVYVCDGSKDAVRGAKRSPASLPYPYVSMSSQLWGSGEFIMGGWAA
jgi:hypothetical protein